jgi:hypothetical protein
VGHGDAEQDQAERGAGEAQPLALADLEAEDAVGHDRDEHDATGEHDLHHRERGQRDGGDVQRPRAASHAHADREPLRAPQAACRAQRVADVDRRGRARAPVLEEEAQVRGEGAQKRQQDAEMKGHAA